MKLKSYQFILVLSATIILSVIVSDLFLQKVPSPNLSPDILSLTQPVTYLQGKIIKVQDKTIWVETTFNSFAALPASTENNQAVAPTKAIYTVDINEKTAINRAPVYIPYLLKATSLGSNNGSADDIISGEQIIINSNQDLRTITNRRFTASSVQTSATIANISGKITTISGNQITIKGNLSIPLSLNERPDGDTFTIKITPETEVSVGNIVSGVLKPQKLDLKNLKEGQVVTIFVNRSETQPFPALLIQPISIATGDVTTPSLPLPSTPLY